MDPLFSAFIIGLPDDAEAGVMKSINLADELNLFSVTFPIAVPYPGTELYRLAKAEKNGMKILSYDWDRYGKQEGGVLESKDLSKERRKELQEIAYKRHPKKDLELLVSQIQRCNQILKKLTLDPITKDDFITRNITIETSIIEVESMLPLVGESYGVGNGKSPLMLISFDLNGVSSQQNSFTGSKFSKNFQ